LGVSRSLRALATQGRLGALFEAPIFDPLATPFTDPVGPLIHFSQSLLQFVNAKIAAAGGVFSDLLHLHGIQARQPSHRDIDRYRPGIHLLAAGIRPQPFQLFTGLNLQIDLLLNTQHSFIMTDRRGHWQECTQDWLASSLSPWNPLSMKRTRPLVLALLGMTAVAPAHPEHLYALGLAAPSPATVLLITSPELQDAWKPFADWKRRLGKPVRILTTQQIADRYEAADLQEKIRRCVRNHVDHLGTRWVILGGDSEPNGKGVVPDRDSFHDTRWGKDAGIPTDIYYLGKKSWDADKDGIYGEWEDDRDAITYPDGTVGLGRIPVRTAADVKAYTDKVIAYESQYPANGFATTMTYTCPVPSAYPKLRTSWDAHVSKVFPGGSVQRFFADETPWDQKEPGDYPLSPSNWINLLNEGKTGKLHMHGHGLLNSWILEDGEAATTKHVAELSNRGAYPVITTVSCFTGQFDAEQDPSIAEAMLRQPNAGAALMVAPSREGKPHFLDPKRDTPLMITEGKLDGTTRTMTLFWENGLGMNLTAGEALMLTKSRMAEDASKSPDFHLCLCELNLLGDPTLPLHSTAPRRPEIAGPKSLEAGNLSLVIETDAPGALMSILDAQGLYGVQLTDDDGNATFPIAVDKDSTIILTVSGPGLNSASLEIPVR